jgi:hypothetical protein
MLVLRALFVTVLANLAACVQLGQHVPTGNWISESVNHIDRLVVSYDLLDVIAPLDNQKFASRLH